MMTKILVFLLLLISCHISAQGGYKLDKKAKKELKVILKEGWETLDERATVEEQFCKWHQIENEGNYTVSFFEKEYPNLNIARKLSLNEACSRIRADERSHVSGYVMADESVETRSDGSANEHSDIVISNRSSNTYKSTNTDILRLMSIYRKTDTGYMVRCVIAKQTKQ